jgi:hypothetical protein
MRYDPLPGTLQEKRKRCVYCGHTFLVHRSLPSSRIIKTV